MYAVVSTDQFTLVNGSVIHVPTGAEFTPTSKSAESILVWTGAIERLTTEGQLFKYNEVLAAMKAHWLASPAEPFASVG